MNRIVGITRFNSKFDLEVLLPVAKVPAAQLEQEFDEGAPRLLPYIPPGQPEHDDEPAELE
jgi:hypothetical protein